MTNVISIRQQIDRRQDEAAQEVAKAMVALGLQCLGMADWRVSGLTSFDKPVRLELMPGFARPELVLSLQRELPRLQSQALQESTCVDLQQKAV